MNIIGIDPGKSGAIAYCNIYEDDKFVKRFSMYTIKLSESEQDICDQLVDLMKFAGSTGHFAYIENVHSMPKQGVVSAFTFGRNFGFLIGLLTALKIPYEFVSPQKWQKAMGCLSKGDKNVTKAAAQRLFPDIKITHAIADALLIAEYGRRIKK
jgi:crossover junction endodeoxyribonuclease RuvC